MLAMRDRLPPSHQWPSLLPVPDVVYPGYLNASVALLDENVRQGRGQRVALYWEHQAITYEQLLDQVERFATSLVRAGLTAGDRVLLRLPNRPEFIIAWLSILRIGAIAVATMPLLRARELVMILDDCQPRLAICQHELLEDLERAVEQFSGVSLLVVGSVNGPYARFEDWLNAAPNAQPADTRAEDIALLAYTSGSTGMPKGTIHFHRDVLAIADTYSRHILRPTPDDVFGGHPTLAFTFGLGGLLIFPFRAGASTVLLERFTPERLLHAIRDYQVSIVFCAPTTYKMLLRDYGERLREYLTSLRIGVSAGETLPAAVFSEWKQRTGITLLDGIGSTEMLHIFISNSLEEAVPGSTGRVVPGYEAKVVDQNLNEVPAGTPGLLAVRGPTGCRYWNRPDKQAEYVRDGWNFPGDMFFQDEQGLFHYVCRADDLIICAGHNIAGPEVEAVLLQHAAVKEVAVVASPDELKGFVPKAFVVLSDGWQPDDRLVKELQEFVKHQIAPYKYPRKIEFVEQLPRTQTGKIRRVELRQLELERWRLHES